MSYYKVNMMGGFRVSDRNQVLGEGEVYEFTASEVADSRGIAAALRERWLIETDASGKPLVKAKPKKQAATSTRSPAEEAEMYPSDSPVDEDAELKRVNAEEVAIRFEDNIAQDVANEMVATPAGPIGPRKKSAGETKPKIKPKTKRDPGKRKSKRRPKRNPSSRRPGR